MSSDEEIAREQAALARLDAMMETITADLHYYWRMGDGCGGYFLNRLRYAVIGGGGDWPLDWRKPVTKRKKKISGNLSKRVFERDAYRCVTCGSHIDLCCDHIIPESKGGPTTFENLQAMCRPCNSRKGNRSS